LIGVVFDCDGTLVDSEPLSAEAWRRTLAPYGYLVTDEDLAACVGSTYTRTHAFMAERAELPDADAFWPDLRETLFALLDEHLEPFPDAIQAVNELIAMGIAIAVASSSVRERLDHTLRGAGLHFDVTIAGDEVEHGKPAPDIFLAAAGRLNVAPEDCVVVEDSPPGVAAGRAAGMVTLAVCRIPGTEHTLVDADALVHTVTAEAILSLISDRALGNPEVSTRRKNSRRA
jgi:HAD superfamily hydrolase (TIGR01509 family)